MYFVIKFYVKWHQNTMHGTENCWLKLQQQLIHRFTGTILSTAWNVTDDKLYQQKFVKTESVNIMLINWVADWLVWQLFKKQWFDLNNVCLWSICTQSGCVRAGGRDPCCPSVCCYCNCAGNLLLQNQDEGRTGFSPVSLLWSPGNNYNFGSSRPRDQKMRKQFKKSTWNVLNKFIVYCPAEIPENVRGLIFWLH